MSGTIRVGRWRRERLGGTLGSNKFQQVPTGPKRCQRWRFFYHRSHGCRGCDGVSLVPDLFGIRGVVPAYEDGKGERLDRDASSIELLEGMRPDSKLG